ncbi:hypothetical protein FDK38_002281 [Candidozyma auris]|nr:hypothetical protein FDK38_002281 [[Candida] auris]
MIRNGWTLLGRSIRNFSSTRPALSFIGGSPVRLAEGVEVSMEKIPPEFCRSFVKGKQKFMLDQNIVVRGPKGKLKTLVPSFVKIDQKDDLITVSVDNPDDKIQKSMWGTSRAILHNNVIGTSEGHLAIVKFVGVGYRALLEEENGTQVIGLKVGYPYTPKYKVPSDLKASLPSPARLLIEGIDKQQVKLFAARIREFKKPEPYKGKGLYVDDETIRLKQKKIK